MSKGVKAMSFGNFRIDWRMFKYFKPDFYKYFLKEESKTTKRELIIEESSSNSESIKREAAKKTSPKNTSLKVKKKLSDEVKSSRLYEKTPDTKEAQVSIPNTLKKSTPDKEEKKLSSQSPIKKNITLKKRKKLILIENSEKNKTNKLFNSFTKRFVKDTPANRKKIANLTLKKGGKSNKLTRKKLI